MHGAGPQMPQLPAAAPTPTQKPESSAIATVDTLKEVAEPSLAELMNDEVAF